MTTPVHRQHTLCLAVLGALSVAGCAQFIDPNVPEPIRPLIEPELGSEYLLYRPSQYNRDYAWPLVIVTHTGMGDSPNQRIRAWTQLAESHGFLVAAPVTASARAGWLAKPEELKTRLQDDERRILSTLQHVRAAHTISPDRVFIHGWAGGAMAALYTGLKHPDLFRAVAVSAPHFDEERLLADMRNTLDHQQPVLVDFSVSDALTGSRAKKCVEWLRTRGANLTEDPHGAVLETDTDRPLQFFREILRKTVWIRVHAFAADPVRPLDVQFKIRASQDLTTYEWDFGDGKTSTLAAPLHTYAAPGVYRVLAHAFTPDGTRHRRAVTLRLPEAVIGNTPPDMTASP